MIPLTTPISEEQIRALKVGDAVEISGVLFTGRDAVHKYLHEGGQLPPKVNRATGFCITAARWSSKTSKAGGR
jgi:fumarate hydratase class I